MVKITNGVNVFEVTRGAFDGIYSRQGYTILNENDSSNAEAINVPEKSEDEKFIDEIIEKPISQWSKEEVKRFAVLKEIDITGTRNVNEAKEIIKNFIEVDSQE